MDGHQDSFFSYVFEYFDTIELSIFEGAKINFGRQKFAAFLQDSASHRSTAE